MLHIIVRARVRLQTREQAGFVGFHLRNVLANSTVVHCCLPVVLSTAVTSIIVSPNDMVTSTYARR